MQTEKRWVISCKFARNIDAFHRSIVDDIHYHGKIMLRNMQIESSCYL